MGSQSIRFLHPPLAALLLLAGCYTGVSVDAADPGSGESDDPAAEDTGDDRATGGEDTGGTVEPLCGAEPEVGPTALRRLTRDQYDNAIRDLLGIEADASTRLDADERVGPFTSNSIIPVNERLIEQYMTAAEDLSQVAVANGLSSLLPCDPALVGDSACARTFIETFGRRAFRRPLLAGEVDVFEEVYTLGFEQEGFSSGIQLVLEAMLQAPDFLYLLEFGSVESGQPVVELDGYELASRLSFFLWNSIPDDALLDAAEELADPNTLEAQALRMLEDPRARAAIGKFHTQWVGLHDIESVFKDPELFPSFDEAMARAMEAEVARFAEFVFFEDDARLETLLTAPYTLADESLLSAYGLEVPIEHDPTEPVDLDPTQRSGLLTQLGFLAVNAHHDQTSPVHRGIAIRRNFLCHELPAPPPDVDNTPPPVSPDSTTRERFDQHVADPTCASCHLFIDPIGLAFEHYDPIGAWRTKDGFGDVDASGELIGVEGADGPFYGAVELGQRLSEAEGVRQCVTQQWFRFAFGRSASEADECAMDEVYEAFEASDYDMRELLLAVIRSPSFRYLRVEAQE